MSLRRIRDPLHDLITFDQTDKQTGELEKVLWSVVESRPFQRLRRVKQLGFSELVYPGATHTRFAHSLGVFETARRLMRIVHDHAAPAQTKEWAALAAALVHDLGHGPFSHAFESVGKRLGLGLADHEAMSEALIRAGEVGEILGRLGSGFANDVADILRKSGVKSVHHAVVSSQFDADRLDYMRRDRLMTGTQHSAIDFPWLLANLKIGSVPVGVDDDPLGTVETFVIGPKAIYAAEAYILGLFQLYPTVYLHKTTRGAELVFVELLCRIVQLVRGGVIATTGLPDNHPLVRFAIEPGDLDRASALDDAVIWGSLSQMQEAEDGLVAGFATRLRERKLLKCRDIRIRVAHALFPEGVHSDDADTAVDQCCAKIEGKLREKSQDLGAEGTRILVDRDERSPYKFGVESKGPLHRINVQTEGGALVDLRERSEVVAALRTYKLSRAYADEGDHEAFGWIDDIIKGELSHAES